MIASVAAVTRPVTRCRGKRLYQAEGRVRARARRKKKSCYVSSESRSRNLYPVVNLHRKVTENKPTQSRLTKIWHSERLHKEFHFRSRKQACALKFKRTVSPHTHTQTHTRSLSLTHGLILAKPTMSPLTDTEGEDRRKRRQEGMNAFRRHAHTDAHKIKPTCVSVYKSP